MGELTVNGVTFEQWLARIDRMLVGHMGVTHSDIADRLWYDAFADEISPAEMVSEIIAEGIDAL